MTISKEILEGTKETFDFLEEIAIAISEKLDEGSSEYDHNFEPTPLTDSIMEATQALSDLRELLRSPDEVERVVKSWRKNNAE